MTPGLELFKAVIEVDEYPSMVKNRNTIHIIGMILFIICKKTLCRFAEYGVLSTDANIDQI